MSHACVYFPKDGTLSVVHKNDPDLNILTKFESRENVEMLWKTAGKSKEVFEGVIIKVGGDEETLTVFASKAYKSLLQDIEPGTPAPEELFRFSIKGKGKSSEKRERVPTKRLEESREQDETLSPPKKMKAHSLTVEPKQKKSKQEQVSVSKHTELETGKKMLNMFQQFSTCSSFTEQEPTTLTDTWSTCNGALRSLDLREESGAQLPVVSDCVLATLRGICTSEFVQFLQKLGDHIESSTCPHTCIKMMTNSERNEARSFMSQLEDHSMNDVPCTSSPKHILELQPPSHTYNMEHQPCLSTWKPSQIQELSSPSIDLSEKSFSEQLQLRRSPRKLAFTSDSNGSIDNLKMPSPGPKSSNQQTWHNTSEDLTDKVIIS